MVSDYHIHTVLCHHATGHVAEYKAAAAKAGVPQICFADHAPNPDGMGAGICMAMDQFETYREMVRALQDGNGPEVLLGIEADYYGGCEKYLPGWLEKGAFDVVLGSVHFMDGWGFDNEAEIETWNTVDVAAVWRRYFKLSALMAKTGLYDVVSHFDLPKKLGHKAEENYLKEIAQPALDYIAAAGMAIEINTSGLRQPACEMYPSPALLLMARERGIPICFGSDSHEPGCVGASFADALRLARNCGYTEYVRFRSREQILTPLPVP